MTNLNYPYDSSLQLKDAGLIAASAAATVASVAAIIDLGTGQAAGEMVVDISAIEVASTDELYTIILEGSDSSDFSAGTPRIVPLASLIVGAGAVIPGAGATSSATGRYVVPWTNDYGGKLSRYVRAYTVVAGTIATGINYVASLSIRKFQP